MGRNLHWSIILASEISAPAPPATPERTRCEARHAIQQDRVVAGSARPYPAFPQRDVAAPIRGRHRLDALRAASFPASPGGIARRALRGIKAGEGCARLYSRSFRLMGAQRSLTYSRASTREFPKPWLPAAIPPSEKGSRPSTGSQQRVLNIFCHDRYT